MSIRTDLAVESARQLSLSRDLEGVSQNIDISEDAALEITEITVETEKAAEILGKLAYLAGFNPSAVPKTAEALLADFDWDKVPTEDIRIPEGLF